MFMYLNVSHQSEECRKITRFGLKLVTVKTSKDFNNYLTAKICL